MCGPKPRTNSVKAEGSAGGAGGQRPVVQGMALGGEGSVDPEKHCNAQVHVETPSGVQVRAWLWGWRAWASEVQWL